MSLAHQVSLLKVEFSSVETKWENQRDSKDSKPVFALKIGHPGNTARLHPMLEMRSAEKKKHLDACSFPTLPNRPSMDNTNLKQNTQNSLL